MAAPRTACSVVRGVTPRYEPLVVATNPWGGTGIVAIGGGVGSVSDCAGAGAGGGAGAAGLAEVASITSDFEARAVLEEWGLSTGLVMVRHSATRAPSASTLIPREI